MPIDKKCLDIINERYGTNYKGAITERDMAVQRNELLASPAPRCFPLYYRIKHFVSPVRIGAKYDLFMFNLEDKMPNLYSTLISFGFPKPC
jgi:hypothetical protein